MSCNVLPRARASPPSSTAVVRTLKVLKYTQIDF